MTTSKARTLTMSCLSTVFAFVIGALLGFHLEAPEFTSSALRREIAQHRPIEARLSLYQQYSSCVTISLPEDSVPWARCPLDPEPSQADLVRFRRILHSETDYQALGMASLIWRDQNSSINDAIDYLERALSEKPNDPARANDLAAALIERAGLENRPADLIASLDLLERSLQTFPASHFLLFNRALVLEKLQLLTLAQEAWADYLDVDPTSAWALEAQSHLSRSKAHNNDRTKPKANKDALTLARHHPRAAREFTLQEALVRWGRATIAGRKDEANRWLLTSQIIGKELARLGGDQTALDVTEEISYSSQDKMENLAKGLLLYGNGHRLFQQRDYVQAENILLESRRRLADSNSSVALWAELDLAAIELHNTKLQEATRALSALLAKCERERHPALYGRTSWALALGLFRLGRLAEAREAYQCSADTFLRAREKDNQVAVLGLIAETLTELGNTPLAWRYRYGALRALTIQVDHPSLHNLLGDAGYAALMEGYPLAAKQFADEDVKIFGSGGKEPLLALESYFRRALIGRDNAPASAVLADLHKATKIAQDLPVSPLLQRIDADIKLALADLYSEAEPNKAAALIDVALFFFRKHGLALHEAAALLAKARLCRTQGLNREAEANLEAAARLFELQRGQLTDSTERRLYSETWEGLYDELIDLAVLRPGGKYEAFLYLERSRSEDAASNRPIPLGAEASTVTISYALLPQALHRFHVEQGRLHHSAFPISRIALTEQIRHFVESVRHGAYPRSSTELTKLLIPASLAPESRLCFVLDRELSSLPFAVLPLFDGSGPLVTRHAVAIARSVSDCMEASTELPSPTGTGEVLLAGAAKLDQREFPWFLDLPNATSEILSIQALHQDAIVLTGERATVPALLKALPQAKIFHFAGHAVAHPADPERSFMPLTPGVPPNRRSALYASELSELRLPHLELAFLSSCDTFTPTSGRTGVAGLASALHDAGAQTVAGTLWPVDDYLARQLVQDFYRELQRARDPVLALRVAQLSILQRAGPKALSTWAAFEVSVSRSRSTTNQQREVNHGIQY